MEAARRRLKESIDSTIDYMNVLKVFKVRKRPMICPRCKQAVERMVQANRGTYWCPTCQTIGGPKVHPAEFIADEPLHIKPGSATELVAGMVL